jgi:hypothetical protein
MHTPGALHRLAFAAIAATALASPARAATGDNAIGINTHIPSNAVIDLVADTGAKWIRVDNNWLDQTNPCSGSITFFAPLDNAVSYAVSKGLKVYMTLAYTPACASTGNGDGMSSRNDVPMASLYGNYVRQAVAHYRAMGVTHFGLWNEANLEQFFEGSAAQYVSAVVAPGIPAITMGCSDAGHSDCKALGPDLAHVGDYDVFLEQTLQAMSGSSLSFDILAHHIYQGFDVQVWDGDSFVNALEMRRFQFTRRSLLDVLTDNGLASGGVPSIEIWITETGYRANPPTDTNEMQTQANYYMSVIDMQLGRAWYTNTFFYEILDSMDSIDGYGITRTDGNGFILKPAYDALKNRIATEPQLNGTAAPVDAGPGGNDDAGSGPGSPDGGAASQADAGGIDPTGPDAGNNGTPADGDDTGCCQSSELPAGSALLIALVLAWLGFSSRGRRWPNRPR